MIKDKQYIQFLSYIPKILLAIIIPIFDDLYHKVAVWLNDMGKNWTFLSISAEILQPSPLDETKLSENYRTDESAEEHFVYKLILVSKADFLAC